MEIKLYKNFSEVKEVNKELAEEITLTGSIRDDSIDVLNPVITVNADTAYLNYNYAYIPDFGRYYFFATPPAIIRTGVFQLFLHVDVLMSFKGTAENGYSDGFLGNSGFAEVTANYGNFYLTDPKLPLQQNTQITTHKVFDTLFSASSVSGVSPSTVVINATNVSDAASVPRET